MINKNIFSVSDSVIKHIVHERHRHQRELLLNSERDANWKDLEKRRKHANSRRTFQEQVEELSQLIKKITKAYGIVRSSKEYGVAGSSKEYGVARSSKSAPPPSSSSSSSLSSSSSPSPSPFPSPSSSFSSSNSSFLYYEEMDRDLRTALRNEIAGIMDRLLEDKALNTRKTFDSQRNLEVSETDSDNPNKRKIIIRDLKWRSATVYDTEYAPNENSAPVNASKWVKIGYKGSLKHLVEKYSANREEVENDKSQEDDDKIQEDDDKIQEDDDNIKARKTMIKARKMTIKARKMMMQPAEKETKIRKKSRMKKWTIGKKGKREV
ncbi:hypothetical protein RhiirA1_447051 [Rhizophagus irregularis]|uniref:Uncharacterized protein n=1 Tax=Rhizophagus irregularis TaxID=588596 RepID=A0A2N0QTY1_9GLOM|nr:hypothetical protein RhiirA1_447051 [Rhizophagus irregularis]